MRKVLVVGMVSSIHIVRFCRAIDREEWQVYLFPCHDAAPHADLEEVVVLDPTGSHSEYAPRSATVERVFPWSRLAQNESVRGAALARVIARLRPDVVHAQELQHGGYLVAAATRLLRNPPPIVTTIWGSDLSLRSRMPEHLPRIRAVLARTEVLTAECARDYGRARELGYAGYCAPPMPVAGGLDMQSADALRSPGPTSARTTIAVKGYHGWAGRSQVALRALERCRDLLGDYEIAIYSAHPDSVELAQRLAAIHGLNIRILSERAFVAHEEVIGLHGRSRASIGLSTADGISTSLLEAMAMGSFPIQSDTACVDGWITDGETGLIVPPEEPGAVAAAIARALTDDDLVDTAAAVNARTIATRLTDEQFRADVAMVYDRAARSPGRGQRAQRGDSRC